MWIKEIFKVEKPVIGMVHLAPLPGSPHYNLNLDKILERALRDAEALVKGGVDGILISNEGDAPYLFQVGPETVASMTYLVTKITSEYSIPFGVDVLWDPYATIAVAKATGAKFFRTILVGVHASDLGLINTECAKVLRYKRAIDAAHIKTFVYLNPEFGTSLSQRPLELVAKAVAFMSIADALCISGPMTGMPTRVEDLKIVKKAVPHMPVIINTGANKFNIRELLLHADGVIVGTSLKKDGITWNPVDINRVKEFMEVVNTLR